MSDSYKANELVFQGKRQDRSVTGHGTGQECHGTRDRSVSGHIVKTPILVLWGQCCLSVWDLRFSWPTVSRDPLEAN